VSKWPRVEHPVTIFYLSPFCDYKTLKGHRFLIVHHFLIYYTIARSNRDLALEHQCLVVLLTNSDYNCQLLSLVVNQASSDKGLTAR
jgi:ABC-type arginine/histidine transport system permease subunit